MPNSLDTPVLVAGGGPTGLYLALLLAQAGVPVRVIERDRRPQLGSRGNGIMSRSLEIMHMLGLLPEIERNGMPHGLINTYKGPRGEELLEQTDFIERVESTPNAPLTQGILIGQHVHTRIVRAALTKYNVEVEVGKTIRGFTQDEDGVTCDVVVSAEDGTESTETIRASFLCGADGARGAVRKLLGSKFVGETMHADAIIVADIPVKGPLDHKIIHLWSDKDQPGGLNIMMMRTEHSSPDLIALIVLGANFDISTIDLEAPRAIQRLFKQHVAREDIVLGDPVWLSYFRPGMRMVDNFGDKRVFVLGDAAHTHSPTGGQGMNSGIQDALNLYWKMHLVYKNLASPSLLKTFNSERLPIIAQMLNKTTLLYKRWNDPKQGIADPGQHVHGREVLMLGINYRWSEIVLDARSPRDETEEGLNMLRSRTYGGHEVEEGKAKVVAGDRAPDAPALLNVKTSQMTRLFDIFDLKRHTILVFASAASPTLSNWLDALQSVKSIPAKELQTVVVSRESRFLDGDISRPADYILTDSKGYAFGGYDIREELVVVVVRPDTYIGAIVKNPADMDRYFTSLLSFGGAGSAA